MEDLLMASEEKTKGLVVTKLCSLNGYPKHQNIEENEIVFYKENSYEGTKDDFLREKFSKASKSQSGKSQGTPDFVVIKKNCDTVIVIECKEDVNKHSRFEDVNDYRNIVFGSENCTEKNTKEYAVDGALWYASQLNDMYNVIAIAVSGVILENSKVTSFVLPKIASKLGNNKVASGCISEIKLLENSTLKDCLVTIDSYIETANRKLGRDKTEEDIKKALRSYTVTCSNFLRNNGIEDNDKAGFISCLILALTNKDSDLRKLIESDIYKARLLASKKIQKKDIESVEDSLGENVIELVNRALNGYGTKGLYDYKEGIFDIDEIPEGKRIALKKYYKKLLDIDGLLNTPKNNGQDFKNGSNVLSACLYSLYLNVIESVENYKSIDVMGEFYTTFLRFTKGNAKEKGIVLTPKHITELFCDIAEKFGGKLTEETKIIDTCCGTGTFLIAALNRIKSNIENSNVTDEIKESRIKIAQTRSLIGVEANSSMYSLAYANMRFHGDGKSNLFNCSSLLSDSYASTDKKGSTYSKEGKQIKLADAIKEYGNIDYGFINPPYSLSKNDDLSKVNYPEKIDGHDISAEILLQKGQSELDFIASMLYYLKKGGIGIAIVPMSCAGNGGKNLRKSILQHHTLLACMSMPANLFKDSNVGVATAIMVFKAHESHDLSKSVFFGRWIEDGFKVIPHNGRKETPLWKTIQNEWMNEIDGSAEPNETLWIRKKLPKLTSEALAEAYIKTDYSKLKQKHFEINLKKYCLFKFKNEHEELDEYWYMDDDIVQIFNDKYAGINKQTNISLKDRNWGQFCIGNTDYFHVERGEPGVYLKDLGDGDIPYISTSTDNNGITAYKDVCNRDGNLISLAYDGSIGASFYQTQPFFASEKIVTIDTVQVTLTPYIAMFLIPILQLEAEMYSYGGRKWAVNEQLLKTEIKVPVDGNGNPDWQFMEDYIKSLPFSSNL